MSKNRTVPSTTQFHSSLSQVRGAKSCQRDDAMMLQLIARGLIADTVIKGILLADGGKWQVGYALPF